MTDDKDDNNIVNLERHRRANAMMQAFADDADQFRAMRDKLLDVALRDGELQVPDHVVLEATINALVHLAGRCRVSGMDLVKALCNAMDGVAGGNDAWSDGYADWIMEGIPSEWMVYPDWVPYPGDPEPTPEDDE